MLARALFSSTRKKSALSENLPVLVPDKLQPHIHTYVCTTPQNLEDGQLICGHDFLPFPAVSPRFQTVKIV